MFEKALYERLGGAFAIAAVVDHLSDAVIENAASWLGAARGCGTIPDNVSARREH